MIGELSLPQNLRPLPTSDFTTPTAMPMPSSTELTDPELDFQQFKERYEKDFIVRALRRFNGRINQTSVHTNIPKKTLLRKIEKYKINTDEFRK